MTWVWVSLFILGIIYVLHKEHQDRKKPTLIGELVSGDSFAPPIKKDLTKSWWEKILATAKSLFVGGVLISSGWLIHDLLRLLYG